VATRTPRKFWICPSFKDHLLSRQTLALRLATCALLYGRRARRTSYFHTRKSSPRLNSPEVLSAKKLPMNDAVAPGAALGGRGDPHRVSVRVRVRDWTPWLSRRGEGGGGRGTWP
jgi:hypothetical protein